MSDANEKEVERDEGGDFFLYTKSSSVLYAMMLGFQVSVERN